VWSGFPFGSVIDTERQYIYKSPRWTKFFFLVGPVRKLKMPSQEKIIPAWMLQGWGSGKQMLEPGKQD